MVKESWAQFYKGNEIVIHPRDSWVIWVSGERRQALALWWRNRKHCSIKTFWADRPWRGTGLFS